MDHLQGSFSWIILFLLEFIFFSLFITWAFLVDKLIACYLGFSPWLGCIYFEKLSKCPQLWTALFQIKSWANTSHDGFSLSQAIQMNHKNLNSVLIKQEQGMCKYSIYSILPNYSLEKQGKICRILRIIQPQVYLLEEAFKKSLEKGRWTKKNCDIRGKSKTKFKLQENGNPQSDKEMWKRYFKAERNRLVHLTTWV